MTSTEGGEEWNAVTGEGGLLVLAYIMSPLPRFVSFFLTQRIRVSQTLYVCSFLGGRPLQMKVRLKVPRPPHSLRLFLRRIDWGKENVTK